MPATVYLIPTVLAEGQTDCLPAYIVDAIKACSVFVVENERTARRYLKQMWKEIVIDDYEWFSMKEITEPTVLAFRQSIKDRKVIGLLSEAGCPGIADPGQQFVKIAQEMRAIVKPLVGPNSIVLALRPAG